MAFLSSAPPRAATATNRVSSSCPAPAAQRMRPMPGGMSNALTTRSNADQCSREDGDQSVRDDYFIEACSQLTLGFISAKVPCGFAFQAQTCSS